jgi:hypothetical protein
MVVRRRAGGLAPLLLMLGACGNTVTHQERIPFSHGNVELVITSVGSAIDGEKYQLIFQNGKRPQIFFTGWNFTEFKAAERNGKLSIQMCRGHIDHAEAIAVTDTELIWPDLNWNCLDKSHEA